MFASPFFTSGRAAILPTIANKEELHTANSLTQTTQWTTLTIGAFLGGTSVMRFGYKWRSPSTRCRSCFRPPAFRGCASHAEDSARERTGADRRQSSAALARIYRRLALHARFAADFRDRTGGRGLGHRRRRGADSVQRVRRTGFQSRTGRHRRHLGLRPAWDLLIGGAVRALARQADFVSSNYKRDHQHLLRHPRRRIHAVQPDAQLSQLALFFIALSRAAVARQFGAQYVAAAAARPNEFRGRVFATIETWTWSTMMLSMAGAGVASETLEPAHDRRGVRGVQLAAPHSSGGGPTGPGGCRSRRSPASSRKKSKCTATRWSEWKTSRDSIW